MADGHAHEIPGFTRSRGHALCAVPSRGANAPFCTRGAVPAEVRSATEAGRSDLYKLLGMTFNDEQKRQFRGDCSDLHFARSATVRATQPTSERLPENPVLFRASSSPHTSPSPIRRPPRWDMSALRANRSHVQRLNRDRDYVQQGNSNQLPSSLPPSACPSASNSYTVERRKVDTTTPTSVVVDLS